MYFGSVPWTPDVADDAGEAPQDERSGKAMEALIAVTAEPRTKERLVRLCWSK
jgi:hypothetical protein